jgi:hypothetical protein
MPEKHPSSRRGARRSATGPVQRTGTKLTTSPYAGKPESSWLGITQQLINDHPLKSAELLDAAKTAWATLWQSTVGTGALSVKPSDLRVPATIVGYFFEVLLARELERRTPTLWRGNPIVFGTALDGECKKLDRGGRVCQVMTDKDWRSPPLPV